MEDKSKLIDNKKTSHEKKASDRPDILVPEGIYIMDALDALQSRMFSAQAITEITRKECLYKIAEWVLDKKLQAFVISDYSNEKRDMPEHHLRRPEFEDFYECGFINIPPSNEFESDAYEYYGDLPYWVYLNKSQFENLRKSVKRRHVNPELSQRVGRPEIGYDSYIRELKDRHRNCSLEKSCNAQAKALHVWFKYQFPGQDVPSVSTIRKNIAAIYKELSQNPARK